MQEKRKILMSDKELEKLSTMKKLEQKYITQQKASTELGLSVRQIRRIFKRYKEAGNQALASGYKGGNRSFSAEFKERAMKIVKTDYADFGPSFASEKLLEVNDIKINRETLRLWMVEEKLWQGKSRCKARIHQSRLRRVRRGELIQIDGSHHDWFEGRATKCCLLVFIDDATSQIMHLRFEAGETTMGYFRCVKFYVKTYGLPLAFYSDKDSIFTVNMADKVDGLKASTQFQRAMGELGIELILAHSPQAKGRVERANATLQDRLIKEMRLRNICSIEEANKYLPKFIKHHNQKFAVKAESDEDAHKELIQAKLEKLDMILSNQESRVLSKNLEFSYRNTIYKIKRIGSGYSFRGAKVKVCEYTDGDIVVFRDKLELKYEVLAKPERVSSVSSKKEANTILDSMFSEKKNSINLPTEPQQQTGLAM